VETARRVRRAIPALLIGLPIGLLALIGLEVAQLKRREFLPPDPGYRIDAVVQPAAGSTAPLLELAVLGDSTVAGVGSPSQAESLAVLVARRVADGLRRPVHVLGHGVSGARTATVALQLDGVADGTDALLIVVGANDATHATPWPAFAEHTRTLLEAAVARGRPVVLGSTPRFYGTDIIPQPLRFMVDAYAGVLRAEQRAAVATTAGTRLADLALVAPRFEGVPEATSRDGFHPSPIGYGFWADALAAELVAAVQHP
jgi:lysophospholipase L1-like esterase